MMIAVTGSVKPCLKKQFTSNYSEVSPSTRMSQKRSPILTEASFFRPPLLSDGIRGEETLFGGDDEHSLEAIVCGKGVAGHEQKQGGQ
jgi:hypothetical protein